MKASDWFWGIAAGIMGLVFVIVGLLDCLHLLDESNSGWALGYLGVGLLMMGLSSYIIFSEGGVSAPPETTPTTGADAHCGRDTAQVLQVELVNYFGGERVSTATMNSPDPIVLTHAREAEMLMSSLQCRDCDRPLDTNRLRLEGDVLPYDAACAKCGRKRIIRFRIPLFG